MISLKQIPFTYHWIIRNAMGGDVKTVLDLGCGEGNFMKDIARDENWRITGVELYTPSLEKAVKTGVYEKVIKGDVIKLPKTISQKKYDIVFVSQVVEHLKKSDGKKALELWQKLAVKKLIVSTPVGFIEFDPIEESHEKNPLQKHQSGWQPEEFVKLGFEVCGQGARFVYGENGLARALPAILPFWSMVAFLFSPFVYLFPNTGLYMIALKRTK